jgi:hypothetical protein
VRLAISSTVLGILVAVVGAAGLLSLLQLAMLLLLCGIALTIVGWLDQ